MSAQLSIENLHSGTAKPLPQVARRPVVDRFASPRRAVLVPAHRSRNKSSHLIGLLALLMVGLIFVDTYRAGRAVREPASTIESSDRAAAPGRGGSPQVAAEFTGTHANGLPVYRLPPIQVTAVRNADQLRRASEE